MDATEVIRPRPGLARFRRRLGHALDRHAGVPQRLIPVAAFLLGVALCAAVLVGVWRHAASRGDAAQAAQASSDHRLRQTLAQVARLERTLAIERTLLARARTARSTLSARLAALERRDAALAGRLPGRLAAVEATAASLARRSASLTSALASLNSYLAANGSSVDPGFLGAQVRYLSGVSRAGEAGAASLRAELDAVASAAAPLSGAR